uniref:Transmembrane protein n=1 Tax=Strongyloides papillosus TaxID=174720 RepID=A0A0N5BJ56_STREA
MRFLLVTLVLFNTFNNLKGLCVDSNNYYLLGNLTNTSPTSTKCKSDSDQCVYIALNVPGMVMGSMSGCQDNIGDTFTNIVTQRMDIKDNFQMFFDNITNKIDMNQICKFSMSGDAPAIVNTLTGRMEYFIHCYSQATLYINPPVVYNPPSKSANPTKCNAGQDQVTCTEGYCGVFEVAYLKQDDLSQVNKLYQSCPNQLINTIYLTSHIKDIVQNGGFQTSIYHMGSVCANKSYDNALSKAQNLSYFMYINCYTNYNGYTPSIPQIPDLTSQQPTPNSDESTTTTMPSKSSSSIGTTTQKLTTTTKYSAPTANLSFSLFILLVISFFLA